MKQQPVPIHTEYIQIDQFLKLEGVIETIWLQKNAKNVALVMLLV